MTRSLAPAFRASALALFAVSACTVHHMETTEPATGRGVPARAPTATATNAIELRGDIQPGSGARGQLSETEGTAIGHAFVARAGASVSARLGNMASGSAVSLRGPLAAGVAPIDAPILVQGEGTIDLPAAGVYLAVVEGPADGLAGYELSLDCHSEECRPECSPSQSCPDNARCFFVQCVTTPCPSFCQVALPSEPAAPVVSGVGDGCGSRGMAACAAGTFCDFPLDARCGEVDHPGRCQHVPGTCPQAQELVCGCDGQTYGNPCQAQMRGISVRTMGPCAGSPSPVQPGPAQPTTGSGGTDQAATGPGCMRTGCSSQICTEVGNEQTTTCEMRPEYACLRRARCERQGNGQCDWTRTTEFESCVADL